MRLAILGLSASVISVPLSAETLGHPNQLPVTAAATGGAASVQVETRVAAPPTTRPRMVHLADGAVFVITSTARNDASAANVAGQPEHGESRFSQSFRNWIASERAPEVAHVSWSRASDLQGRPIDFSRPIRSTFDRSQSLLPAFLPGSLPSSLPVAAMGLTSGFGMRDHPLLGLRRPHLGIDLAAPSGSPIVATSDGVVSVADWRGGYGLLVALEHGRGIETRYGHMSRLNVAAGQAVHKGDVIGFVGSTGLSTGPHLHYEVRVNGQPVNPAPLLRTR